MFRRNRTPKPVPTPVDPAALTLGLRILADDIAAGDEGFLPLFEEGTDDDVIAAYPTSYWRKHRIAYLGKPGPGEVPFEFDPPAGYEIPAEFLRPRSAPSTVAIG